MSLSVACPLSPSSGSHPDFCLPHSNSVLAPSHSKPGIHTSLSSPQRISTQEWSVHLTEDRVRGTDEGLTSPHKTLLSLRSRCLSLSPSTALPPPEPHLYCLLSCSPTLLVHQTPSQHLPGNFKHLPVTQKFISRRAFALWLPQLDSSPMLSIAKESRNRTG